jgi:hypothetical protein
VVHIVNTNIFEKMCADDVCSALCLKLSFQTAFVPDKEEYNRTKAQLLAQMDVAMGGRAAEEIIYGSEKVTTGNLRNVPRNSFIL